ncbi:MAG TPA: hypothetical protein VE732_02840 [Nitrososphaera sp.]|nr:hypothetical protein [Nitrososphaera sp.]
MSWIDPVGFHEVEFIRLVEEKIGTGQSVSERSIEVASKQIVSHLKNGIRYKIKRPG